MKNIISNIKTFFRNAPISSLTIGAILLLVSCQEDDLSINNPLEDPQEGFVAYKADQVKHGSRTVPPNSYFPTGTYYFFWSYADNGNNEPNLTGTPIFEPDSKYKNDLPAEAALPALGKESSTHYVEVSTQNKKKLNGHMHLYGLCINGDDEKTAYGLAETQELANQNSNQTVADYASNNDDYSALKSILHIAPRGNYANGLTRSYFDYCRGYVHYDPEDEQYATASSFVIPFTHAMSQVKVTVLQEGEDEFIDKEDDEGNPYKESIGTRSYDINLKSIRIMNEYTTVDYNAIDNAYSNHGHLTTYVSSSKDHGATSGSIPADARYLWKDLNESKDFPIPLSNDQNQSTNIQATTLVVPQGVKPATMPDPEREGQPVNIVYNEDFSLQDTENTLWLELVITGADAWKFDNNYQESVKDDQTKEISIRIPIEDNTTPEGHDPLRFLPNHAYNLVVMFHGDNVHIVTIKPLIYPWFDGERDAYDDENGFYEPSDIGSPMVFGNVQWNDRYMGSDFVNPKNLEEFIKATGFYYQKDRSIPFYPSIYTGGYVYDIYGNIHDLEYAEQNSGQTVTIDGITYATKAPVLFRTGGSWTDPTPEQMLNYPRVYPIVPYYLNNYQLYVDQGVYDYSNKDLEATYSDALYALYLKDKHEYRTDKYCTYVDEYYDRATGKVRTFTKDDKNLDYMMRYIANMDGYPTGLWNDVNMHPCPPGWRLPTADELYTILPSTPLAGNITFLRDFRVLDGAIGSDDGNTPTNGLQSLELYVRIPYEHYYDLYPPLHTPAMTSIDDVTNITDNYSSLSGGERVKQLPNWSYNKGVNFPAYDPEPGDVTQYVISKRKFSAEEYNALPESVRNKISLQEYQNYADQIFTGKPNNPTGGYGKHEVFRDREWGTIFAIKKQGTPEAYRMRWRVEPADPNADPKIQPDREKRVDVYNLVVDKYKCSRSDELKYDIEDINDPNYYLNYDWDHPESTLYFPIAGLVSDDDMAQYIPQGTEKKGGAMVYNYGTETIILTSEYRTYTFNAWIPDGGEGEHTFSYAAAYRIKIAGTNSYSLYLYPSMERLAQGGLVRPVRTAR